MLELCSVVYRSALSGYLMPKNLQLSNTAENNTLYFWLPNPVLCKTINVALTNLPKNKNFLFYFDFILFDFAPFSKYGAGIPQQHNQLLEIWLGRKIKISCVIIEIGLLPLLGFKKKSLHFHGRQHCCLPWKCTVKLCPAGNDVDVYTITTNNWLLL